MRTSGIKAEITAGKVTIIKNDLNHNLAKVSDLYSEKLIANNNKKKKKLTS